MRAILMTAAVLLCLCTAVYEPARPQPISVSLPITTQKSFTSLLETESSKQNDSDSTAASPSITNDGQAAPPQTAADPSGSGDGAVTTASSPNDADAMARIPLDQVCSALLTSAQDNDLPVAFFANLIWQESRLRDYAVSPKGALGIAQFMPRVAAASGLENPFDPLQALAASARLLGTLRDRFGNLGLVAAAYNAGAKRVSEWLQRGRALPHETRGYVIDVTGRSVEQWRKAPDDDALQFVRRLPCRDLPGFTELEQAQNEQAQQQRLGEAQTARPQPQKARQSTKIAKKAEPAKRPSRARVAEGRHPPAVRRDAMRTAERKRPAGVRGEAVRTAERERGKREAKQRFRHAPRQERRRV